MKINTGSPTRPLLEHSPSPALTLPVSPLVFPVRMTPHSMKTLLTSTMFGAFHREPCRSESRRQVSSVKVTSSAQIVWDQVSETITLPGATPVRQFDSRWASFFGGLASPTGGNGFLSNSANSAVLVTSPSLTLLVGWVSVYPCSPTGRLPERQASTTGAETPSRTVPSPRQAPDGKVCFKLSGGAARHRRQDGCGATMWYSNTCPSFRHPRRITPFSGFASQTFPCRYGTTMTENISPEPATSHPDNFNSELYSGKTVSPNGCSQQRYFSAIKDMKTMRRFSQPLRHSFKV